MSILIEGVDMPRGTNMMLLISPKGEVWEMGDLLGNDKLIDGAKAIPVPPHGRLIDADALMKLEVVPSDNWVFRAIESAPTIIPADKEDEK